RLEGAPHLGRFSARRCEAGLGRDWVGRESPALARPRTRPYFLPPLGVVSSKIAGIVPMRTMMVPTMAARFTSPLSRVMASGRERTERPRLREGESPFAGKPSPCDRVISPGDLAQGGDGGRSDDRRNPQRAPPRAGKGPRRAKARSGQTAHGSRPLL